MSIAGIRRHRLLAVGPGPAG